MSKQKVLIDIIRKTLERDEICLEDNIEVDSLKFVEVIIALEDCSGKLIDIEDIYQGSYKTYQDLVNKFQEVSV